MPSLADYLEKHPGTDAAFAAAIGVSRQSLHRYKTGERRPEWDVLERILRVTDGAVTPNDFMGRPSSPAARTPGARAAKLSSARVHTGARFRGRP